MPFVMVKIGRGFVLVSGNDLETTKVAVDLLNNTCYSYRSISEKLMFVQDGNYPEIWQFNQKGAINTRASVVEVKVISAILEGGNDFELYTPPYQDSISTVYLFKKK